MVVTHPISGSKTLYFSPATLSESTKEIDLEGLVRRAEENRIEVHYKENDIVIFDNLRWMHKRPSFQGHRQLWRISFCYGVDITELLKKRIYISLKNLCFLLLVDLKSV